MALLDFLKNKQKAEEIKEVSEAKNEPKKTGAKKAKAKKEEKAEAKNISFEGTGALGVRILKQPHITEKATQLAEGNKYVFQVYNSANKVEVKKIIEKMYGVKVEFVNILNVIGKKRRVGRSYGKQSGFKKAIVTLPKGQKIDILAQ